MVHTGLVLALLGLSFLLPDVVGDKHSLYYLYTVQSKSSTDRVSEFSAVTLLDDRQIDSYSSTDGIRTPKQDWMKEMKESEWTDGTEKLRYDEQYLNKILDIQMIAYGHNESDRPFWQLLHFLSGAGIGGVTVGVVGAVLGGIIYVYIKKRKSRGGAGNTQPKAADELTIVKNPVPPTQSGGTCNGRAENGSLLTSGV